MSWKLACLLAMPVAMAAQGSLLDEIVLHIRDNLDRLPNYTCTMLVDRSQRLKGEKEFRPLDKVRLEVALVGNQELYAWPGSRQFSDQPLYGMLGDGMSGTGQFGLYQQTVFLSGVAQLQYAGQEELNGRRTHRFRYRVSRALSHYEIRFPGVRDTVGMEGSAWIDAATLDLARLEIEVREIPSDLPLDSGHSVIDYARQRVGAGEFLLPAAAEQRLLSRGMESRNATTFSGCRAYSTESSLSFDEKPMTAFAPVEKTPLKIPPGVDVEARLETAFDSATVARGDPFEATVARTARRAGVAVVPKGAKVSGRVVGVVRSDAPMECAGVILRPERIEFEGREGAFAADQVLVEFTGPAGTVNGKCPFTAEPGATIVESHGASFHFKSGKILLWRTAEAVATR